MNNTKRVLAAVALGAAASLGVLTTTVHADTPGPGCHHSDAAEIHGLSGPLDTSYNVACSGAEAKDLMPGLDDVEWARN